MKKSFRLIDLDCANCAAKMEQRIRSLDGVKAATVSFMTQRLVLETEGEIPESLLDAIEAVIRKVEPDCRLVR